jgi:hypothetical protein
MVGRPRPIPTFGSPTEIGPQGAQVLTGRRAWTALAALVLLAACLPEFLTGSTFVPDAVFHPLGFAQLLGLYGGGALVIRETTVRWNKRWASVLLLGAVFCIIEEGLGSRVLIDPTGSRAGASALYSYWLGVNWVPLAALTLFHAVFSIALQILLVELLFPETRGRRLLGNAGLAGGMFVLGLAATTMALAEPFVPSVGVIAFFVGLSAAYIIAAHLVHRDLFSTPFVRWKVPEWGFFAAGAAFVGEVYLLIVGPHLLSAAGTAAQFLVVASLILWIVVRGAGRTRNELRKIDFALGMIAVLAPIDLIEEVSGDVGVLAFSAFALGLLLYLRSKWLRGLGTEPTLAPPAAAPT